MFRIERSGDVPSLDGNPSCASLTFGISIFPMKYISFSVLALHTLRLIADPVVGQSTGAFAPPPAMPMIHIPAADGQARATATLYSIGDPTPEEQLYLELINRARANAPAEATRLTSLTNLETTVEYTSFGVDLNLMQSQFAAFIAAQPLAMNAKLTTAARSHSQDMFDNVFQEHVGSGGSTLGSRLGLAGYTGGGAGENIFATAKSVEHGHAAFEVDWGGDESTGGMQSPAGHRQTIHNPVYREVGIGIVLGSKRIPGKKPLDHVGPQVVTQDFGVQQNSTPFITGVAFYDLNGNGFYDLGEGIGNVRVTVDGFSAEGMTARSGGYAVPVPGNGTYNVTFSGGGFPTLARTVAVVGSKNQKTDFTPSYTPPSVAGPATATLNRDNAYTISSVAGASEYQWRALRKAPASPEGAENDSTTVSVAQTGSYDVFEGIVMKSGQFAFHLATPTADPQIVTLLPAYLINDRSAITFQSMLGVATPAQHAQVQISADDGATWETIFDQTGVYNVAGNSPPSEKVFSPRQVNLSAYSGKSVRLRFVFLPILSSQDLFITSVDLQAGWIVDDISFSDTEQVLSEQVASVSSSAFSFRPELIADFTVQARAKTGHLYLPWGPPIAVRSAPASGQAEIRLTASALSGQLQIDGDVLSGATPSNVILESRGSLTDAWQIEPATPQSVSAMRFRVNASIGSTKTKFYRLRIQ